MKFSIYLTFCLSISIFAGCVNQEKVNNKINSLVKSNDSLITILKSIESKVRFCEMLDSYGVEILQIGGVGSHQVEVQAYYLSEHGYLDNPKDKIKYYFNSGGDIIWIQPITGYYIESVERDGKGVESLGINSDITTGNWSLQLFDQIQNRFQIVMKKTNFDDYLSSVKVDSSSSK